ncbi:MAG: hypothetical protein AAF713_10085 [Pseudomonadota bacterium]
MALHALESKIDPAALTDLKALPLERGSPVVVVDADEVLVILAGHLTRFLETIGYEMRLTQYRLEGTIFLAGSDTPVSFDEALGLIDRFFRVETTRQEAVEGAAEALARLSKSAQIVILTNVPRFAREARVENLSALGMGYPMVANSGGKGRAVAWIAETVGAPTAFVDDSPPQIVSVAKHAPDTLRIHFVGATYVREVAETPAEARARAVDWTVCEALLREGLALDTPPRRGNRMDLPTRG